MDDTTRFLLIAGGVASVIAIVAWIGDRARMRRRNMDRVGFMPWTTIFFWSLLAAIVLIGVGTRGLISG